MDFDFSEEQEMLRASVRAFLREKSPLRTPFSPVLWTGLSELGVTDLGMVDAAVVLEELGRALCPAPYASSLAARTLSLVDRSTLALFETGTRYSWATPTCRVVDGRLTGEKVHVPDADTASAFVVTACDESGLGVFLAEEGDVTSTPTVDDSRVQGRVAFASVPVIRLAATTGDLAHAVDRLGVAYVVDGVGAAARALELSVEYAKERVQFDKPIGSFQAVQHLCADMLRTVELGRAAAYYACWALDDAPPEEAHRAAVLAQAFAADTFPALGGTAIQVFGGVGFTWDHDIHLYYKRLLTCGLALGTAADHLESLARLAI